MGDGKVCDEAKGWYTSKYTNVAHIDRIDIPDPKARLRDLQTPIQSMRAVCFIHEEYKIDNI